VSAVAALGTVLSAACGGGSPVAPAEDPGALIKTTMTSQVGVVLDEIPAAMRDRVATDLLAKGDDFWIARAKSQANMTKYRLAYRNFYYDTGVLQLPLPPDSLWNVTIRPDAMGKKARRAMVGTHDAVLVDYDFESTLLATTDSAKSSQPELGKVGGKWDEPFIFPVDPELLLQRTGYACMDEVGFPPNSVDSEETAVFYDQECEAEGTPSHTGCHFTALPTEGCTEAVEKHVGRVDTKVHFERLKWDAAVADKARFGDVTSEDTPDIRAGVHSEIFPPPKVIYRYIPDGDCTLVEKCVGGAGWRRLLQFSSVNWNTGAKTLEIGAVDYLLSGMGDGDLASHHIYEYSECHKHYHFMHYGSFTFGSQTPSNSKRGFCLQSTDRLSNNEHSPLNNPYSDCSFQGIQQGWGDNYNAGIDCQWIDVTGFDVSLGPVTDKIHETFNPDGFLCEGKPVLKNGKQVYEPTSFMTVKGEPVDKPKCDFINGWDGNNKRDEDVTLPARGESFVNQPCTRGQIGPLRNCGFKKQSEIEACTPGAMVKLHCTVPATAAPHTARFCESSKALLSGTACTHGFSLANVIVDPAAGADVTFTCPAMRDAIETGGMYSIYSSTLVDEDMADLVTCTVVP
jgi:hypothetical protein